MNLLEDKWLPVIRSDGQEERIAPWQIAEKKKPVMDINTPRPDFQGAMYQFLIGLLQTVFAPEDHEDWLAYWENAPDAKSLRASLEVFASAFELNNPEGPAFMQDFELKPDADEKGLTPIRGLLMDAPGGKTQRDNLDHFVKRDAVSEICPTCCAMALFTLNASAPAGGVGNRVSLRGGGPLTTLVLPKLETPLWHRIWLNVLDQEAFVPPAAEANEHVFPWLAPTRVSDKKGSETTPENAHPLQMYWCMPRRIRICFDTNGKNKRCDLCGDAEIKTISRYVTKNYGVNYAGDWIHPLTPYRFDPQRASPPISLKGQQGGLGYRHWLGLVMNDPQNGDRAAKVTRVYMETRAFDMGGGAFARLWCSGYDMDKMKARCWYDHTFPLFRLKPVQRKNLLFWASHLICAARDIALLLQAQVKAAWFKRPGDAKGDMSFVVSDFWDRSESAFYQILQKLISLPESQRHAPSAIYESWRQTIRALAYKLFDVWALESPAEDLDMKRVVNARNGLKKKLNSLKSFNVLARKDEPEKEAMP